MPIATPSRKWSYSCHESHILAWRFTKRQAGMPYEHWLLQASGNCCMNVKGLAGGMLAKAVNDAGWSAFINTLTYKAAEAGRQMVCVDPRGTSQTCLCGAPVPKTLNQRWHQCEACGLSMARDHVSAQLILRLGLSLLGST